MFLKAGMLIILGILCLIGVVISIIFTVIHFANGKPHKFSWLAAFFICIIGLVTCIFLFVNKVVNKVQTLADEFGNQMEQSMQDFSDSLIHNNDELLQTNEYVNKLQCYSTDSATIPHQFYTYLGFETYYRFPLKFPYSIHCSPFRDNGELFNEKNVAHFDENDNGEISVNITNITKLALDEHLLLLEQSSPSTRSNKVEKHYSLFHFDTGLIEDCSSEKDLLKQAINKGFKGNNKLQSIEEYSVLFK